LYILDNQIMFLSSLAAVCLSIGGGIRKPAEVLQKISHPIKSESYKK